MFCVGSTVVKPLTLDPKSEGSNPTTSGTNGEKIEFFTF
jgi:hypothetical protein